MKAITFASGKGWHWGLIQHKFTVIGMMILLFLSLPPLHCSKASLFLSFSKRLLNSETHIFVVIKLKALLLTLLRVYCVGHTSLIATEYFQALPPAALSAPPWAVVSQALMRSVRKVDENYRTVDTSRKTDKQDELGLQLNWTFPLL